jgi:hypothetical protein
MVWPHWPVRAFNPQPDPPAFGLIGIDPFAVARVNAICAAGPLPGGVNPGPCDVTLGFNDAAGRALKQTRVTLSPGQGTSLDITTRDAGGGRRVELQPFAGPAGHGFVLTTAEVFDEFTGRTMVVVNPTEPRSLGTSTPTAGQ